MAVLGVGVLGAAAYRAFFLATPEAELMGILGVTALATNVASALVLMPPQQHPLPVLDRHSHGPEPTNKKPARLRLE